jgi:CRP-like cAMP-binding protein
VPINLSSVGKTLRGIQLFSGLKEKDLGLVAGAFREVSFEKGSTILQEGEPSHDFFVLVKGKAQVSRGGKTVATLSPHQFFGELTSLGFQRSRTAWVIAAEPCTCLVSGREDLGRILASHPSIARQILDEIGDRYRPENRPVEWW